MNYEEATEFIRHGNIGRENADKILLLLSDDKTLEGLELIKKIANCDDATAKLVWVDLKCEYGSEDTNPFIKAEKIGEENRKAEEIRKAREEVKYYVNAECPYCHSKNTKKISGVSRVASVGFFGFASKKIGKQWHCNKCGSNF